MVRVETKDVTITKEVNVYACDRCGKGDNYDVVRFYPGGWGRVWVDNREHPFDLCEDCVKEVCRPLEKE